jgi:hypothetical protein
MQGKITKGMFQFSSSGGNLCVPRGTRVVTVSVALTTGLDNDNADLSGRPVRRCFTWNTAFAAKQQQSNVHAHNSQMALPLYSI